MTQTTSRVEAAEREKFDGHAVIEAALKKATKGNLADAPFPMTGEVAQAFLAGQASAYQHALEMIPASQQEVAAPVEAGEMWKPHHLDVIPNCLANSLCRAINLLAKTGTYGDAIDASRLRYLQAEIATSRVPVASPAPSSFVNAAGIHASDKPSVVIHKLDAAFHDAITFPRATPAGGAGVMDARPASVHSDSGERGRVQGPADPYGY